MKKSYKYQDELNELESSLDTNRRENPFTVPDDYFSEMKSEILSELIPQDSVKTKMNPIDSLLAFLGLSRNLAFAGICTVLLAGASILYFQTGSQTHSDQFAFDSLSEDLVVEYVYEDIDAFEEVLILDAMAEADLSAFEIDVSDEEFDAFIEDNLLDIDEELLEELL